MTCWVSTKSTTGGNTQTFDPVPSRPLILLLLTTGLAFAVPPVAEARCPDRPACRGCGCKGGPGYRHNASGRCVGFKELYKKCGNPPDPRRCTFENAPGTGANRECALGLEPS